ncbi:MAG: hypothetical protein OQK12_07270, partial [Motiliproteus sp.]|nr:hypothetical protein [Motiliproteus sp.]
MDNQIGDLIRFHKERFFEGAVQLGWIQKRTDQAQLAAKSFVFHGPRYHGESPDDKDSIENGYRLKDTASFVKDLLKSLQAGQEGKDANPFWLAVAGYGSGKSHLALTCASLLSNPTSELAKEIVSHLTQADKAIGTEVDSLLGSINKPALVLPLDGMSGFHLGNALSQMVFKQLHLYGVDADPIRNLSPRFQTAEQFVERNFAVREDKFTSQIPGLSQQEICTRLRENDEVVYAEVDSIYIEANGSPIPIEGQESAQELLDTLSRVYCSEDGPFSQVVILFDEFGRYLEYAAERPNLAGDSALQQIFQGVQDNCTKVRFIGFIQYELKAYLKRFGGADLRQLQRYITRFDAADKCYLSTNLETIFAHMIGKEESSLDTLWQCSSADRIYELSHQRMANTLPGFERYPVWNDIEKFTQIIGRGCWPLHPMAVWFLTRQRDVVQSRSALTFIKDVIEQVEHEAAYDGSQLKQISAAELILNSMLPELVAAEREVGGSLAETLQGLLEKFKGHLDREPKLALAGVAVLEKMRIGRQPRELVDQLIAESSALTSSQVNRALEQLSELGALEWNRDLGQYELLSDGASRGQFQQWLRKQQHEVTAKSVRELFIRRGAVDIELGNISTDFAISNQIATPDWFYEASFAHAQTIEAAIERGFNDWSKAHLPKDAKGKVIYLYLHPEDDLGEVEERVQRSFAKQLRLIGQRSAPIWVIGLPDTSGAIAEQLTRLYIFDERISPSDQERFRRFVPDEQSRSKKTLQEASQQAIKTRCYWISGFDTAPNGRLRVVGTSIFSSVYDRSLPFPFDGFASANGGGAKDAAQLARGLIARQVDGPWVQSQTKSIRNRVNAVLANGWGVLLPSGKLCEPQEPSVSAVYQGLLEAHQENPSQSLLVSYQELIKPPYGLNASSAGLMIGLLLALDSPPRRIEEKGSLVSSSEWLGRASPGKQGKHHLEQAVLSQTTIRFLSEDAETRWRGLLNRWEAEQHFDPKLTLADEAYQMLKEDPLPEAMEGNFKYLVDATDVIRNTLQETKDKLAKWEKRLEKALHNQSIEHAITLAGSLINKRSEMEQSGLWPDRYFEECDTLLNISLQLITSGIGEWIPKQACRSVVQVNDFRETSERLARTLDKLGFKTESNALIQQALGSIHRVEQLQKFKLTLDESEDYPRQPAPSQSTPVRELRDEIAKGDELIESVNKASTVLQPNEIEVRTSGIRKRQEQLKAALDRARSKLGNLYQAPESEPDLKDVLAHANRLRSVFVGTPDELEIKDIIMQINRIFDDIAAWDVADLGANRVKEVILDQIKRQREEHEK